MGSVANVDEGKRELVKDFHWLARLGVKLSGTNGGGIVVHNGSESSFGVDVKSKQHLDLTFVELKRLVKEKKGNSVQAIDDVESSEAESDSVDKESSRDTLSRDEVDDLLSLPIYSRNISELAEVNEEFEAAVYEYLAASVDELNEEKKEEEKEKEKAVYELEEQKKEEEKEEKVEDEEEKKEEDKEQEDEKM
ncbi:uncharacterized protein LOC129899924 [Solanum dulcamara]|uniref:uncharacterized protein LOC129899924 n=1 Tax=Solanum dulcamara TaxID=45834 RepID=UPI002485AA2B|nr:uncharacterized protein LOC129899924 [Solanum dulcamara]